MEISCRTCGQLNPSGAARCQFCGADLPSTPLIGDPFRSRPTQAYPVDRWGELEARYARPAIPYKEPSIGLVIELVPGLFGFLGIGYIWSGEVAIGVALLLGYWALGAVLAVTTLASFGLLLCCFPVFLLYYPGIPIISGIVLYRRLQRRQAWLTSVVAQVRPY